MPTYFADLSLAIRIVSIALPGKFKTEMLERVVNLSKKATN